VVTVDVNGTAHEITADADDTALDVVRDRLRLSRPQQGCRVGVWRACTVELDGAPVVSCLLPAAAVDGRRLTTVEALADHPVARAFVAHAAAALQAERSVELGIVDATDDDRVLGAVGLVRVEWEDQRAEVGYWTAPDARRRGVASRALFACDQVGKGFNWMHYCNPDVDKMVTEGNATSDPAKRQEIYAAAAKKVMEDATFIPIYEQAAVFPAKKNVTGLMFTTTGGPLFYNVSVVG